MIITEIKVSAGTTFNHPYESYANFKPSVEISAAIVNTNDLDACLAALQKKAYLTVVAEKDRILAELKRERDIDCLNEEIDRIAGNDSWGRYKCAVENYNTALMQFSIGLCEWSAVESELQDVLKLREEHARLSQKLFDLTRVAAAPLPDFVPHVKPADPAPAQAEESAPQPTAETPAQ